MDKPGGFVTAPPPPRAAAATDASGGTLEDLSCPCCFRPGKLCDSFVAEEAEQKVRGLRVLLASHGLDAYVVPSGDAHSSESRSGVRARSGSWIAATPRPPTWADGDAAATRRG